MKVEDDNNGPSQPETPFKNQVGILRAPISEVKTRNVLTEQKNSVFGNKKPITLITSNMDLTP